jgi:hypothetical protein
MGIWHDRAILIMNRQAILPDRCVLCNMPADGGRLGRTYSWMPQWVYLFLLLGLIPFVIVAVILQKRAKLQVGICPVHRSRRIRNILISLAAVFGGIVLMIGGPMFASSNPQADALAIIGVMGGIVVIFAGILFGAYGARVMIPKKIDDYFLWLKGADPEFLLLFPPLPANPHP